jgi:DNA polymerase V
MKRCGVKVGDPIWEAKHKCPDGVFIKRDFKWYESLSRKMLAEVGRFSHEVEFHSINESFWAGHPAPGLTYQQTAVAIRDRVKASVGVPMTVTFGRTRTLAKLFADASKPFGALAVLDRVGEREILARLPVTEIAGIAGRRAARLEPYGVRTCLDLADASGLTVKRGLTVVGHDLWRELNGEPATGIRAARPRNKVVARGGSLAGRMSDPLALYGWLACNVERLIEELRYHHVRPAALTVAVSYHDDPSAAGTVRLDVPADRFDRLFPAAKLALRRAWRPGAEATHLHVIATDLRAGPVTGSLFDPPDDRAEAVEALKHEINEELGRWAVRSGVTLFANDFYADPANGYDVCDIRGKFCF